MPNLQSPTASIFDAMVDGVEVVFNPPKERVTKRLPRMAESPHRCTAKVLLECEEERAFYRLKPRAQGCRKWIKYGHSEFI